MKYKFSKILFIICCIFFTSPSPASAANPFTEQGSTYGLTNSQPGNWFDIDQDGDLDVYVSGNQILNKVLINNGVGQAFTDATSTYGLALSASLRDYHSNAIDIDNDGDQDIHVVVYSGTDLIYQNNGPDQEFTDVTSTYGFNTHPGSQYSPSGWADIDSDGDLDLLSDNFFTGAAPKLYQNNGVGQPFTDVSSTYGLTTSTSTIWGTVYSDIDNDGDLDLYISRYNDTNILYQNNGAGQALTDVTSVYGINYVSVDTNRQVVFVDIDNDLDQDIYVVRYNDTKILYQNNGPRVAMTDVTSTYGLGDGPTYTTQATWFDIDLDGDLDLYLPGWSDTSNKLYQNNGVGQAFTDVTVSYGLTQSTASMNTIKIIDFDNDGDQDIVLSATTDTDKLLVNPGQGNQYLKMIIYDENGVYTHNARIQVDRDGNNDFSSAGSVTEQYQVNSTMGDLYVGSFDAVGLNFGLGSNSACIYDIRVFLPGTSPSSTPDYTQENVCPGQSIVFPGPSYSLTDTGTTSDATPSFTGTVTNKSFYSLTQLQYQIDSITGSWSACSANDGTFDETSETFTCTVATSLSNGTHTVYLKATDISGSVQLSNYFGSDSFTIDSSAPTAPTLLSPSGYTNSNTKPTLEFLKTTDTGSGIASYVVQLDSNKNQNWTISGIPSTGDTSKSSYIWRDNSEVKVEFLYENDSSTSNDQINVFFKGLNNHELTEGKHTWKVIAFDGAGNSTEKSLDFYIDHTAPTLGDIAIANEAVVTVGQEYILSNTNRLPSFSGLVLDESRGSTVTNNNGTKDEFESVASGVAKINLVISKEDGGMFYELFNKDYFPSESRFYLTVPYPLFNGRYKVTLIASDKANNAYTYPAFYFNYGTDQTTSNIQNLETKIIRQEATQTNKPDVVEQIKTDGYSLQIKILDKNKQEIPGVKIDLDFGKNVQFTNENGIVNFVNISQGEHDISISYGNYKGLQKIDLKGDDVIKFDIDIQVGSSDDEYLSDITSSKTKLLIVIISILILALIMIKLIIKYKKYVTIKKQ